MFTSPTPRPGWYERHHHLFLGGALRTVEEFFGVNMVNFRTYQVPDAKIQTPEQALGRLNSWIREIYRPLLFRPDFISQTVRASLLQAQADGVSVLETSLGVIFPTLLHRSTSDILAEIARTHMETAPEIALKLDLGFSRSDSATQQERYLEDFLETVATHSEFVPYLSGVDLFDVEDAQPPENFVPIYRKAAEVGLKLKAHVGEFGSAETIRHTVETLDLAEVQHGIHAADSPEILRFLSERGTILNLSPASNMILRSYDYEQDPHPIRKIFDSGVRFTISTDDYTLFHSSISAQLDALTPIFSESEMEVIRHTCSIHFS
ncbi:MAG: hypothetical protein Q4C70_05500 [Planctomycetia bacterium]|nr:hypothetical protein [Planctomycetia bacterium]